MVTLVCYLPYILAPFLSLLGVHLEDRIIIIEEFRSPLLYMYMENAINLELICITVLRKEICFLASISCLCCQVYEMNQCQV